MYFLKLDSWSPGAGFIPSISTKGKEIVRKQLSIMHTKRLIRAIPRLPNFVNISMSLNDEIEL